jgi:hypothetical protein
METHRFTVAPFLLAFTAGLATMAPTNVYKICRHGFAFLHIEPWLNRTSDALRGIVRTQLGWFAAVWRWRMAFACTAIVLVALCAADLSPAGILLAVPPVAAARSLSSLKKKHAKALKDAAAFKQADGSFADDQARAAFDAKMTEVDGLATQIRALEDEDEDDDELPLATGDQTAVERARCIDIRTAVRSAQLGDDVADELIKNGTAIDQARGVILEKLVAKQRGTRTDNALAIVPGEDARDKWVRGASNWLIVRSGMADMVGKHTGQKVSDFEPGEFRGMTLLDLGRDFLQRHNVTFRGLDRERQAGLALSYRSSYQTTSDFQVLLENTLHTILRAAYAITPDTWSRWCGVASSSDFRPQNWYRLGALSVLDSLTEHSEFKNKSIPDAEKATYQLGTKGNIIAITRQTIVNDDVGFVTRLTDMFGRAGKLTIESAVYAKLLLNSGLGPTQADNQPLFHSNRSNVGSSVAISVASIDADRAVMARQKDPNNQEFIDLRPAVLLCATELGGTARVINDAQYDPDTANKLQRPNMVRGLFKDVVDTPRLSGNRRYMFADPAFAPVFLVSFLEGMREPVLETQDGWRMDGVEMKARLDFGVDVVDYRGAVTNAGG